MSKKKQTISGRLIIAFILFSALLLAAIAFALTQRTPVKPYTIIVDGKPLVNVKSRQAAESVLEKVRHSRLEGIPSEFARFSESVTIRPIQAGAEITDIPEAIGALQECVSVMVEIFTVNVDDKPIVALASKEDAETLLNLVKKYYEDKIAGTRMESRFAEDVFIDKRYVDIGKYRPTREDALMLLTSPSAGATVHIVKRGDTAADLAWRHGTSINEMKRLNPGKNLNRIKEGEQLVVLPPKLPITVVSTTHITETASLVPPPGLDRSGITKSGIRKTRLLVTYKNGVKTGEEVLSQITTWDQKQPPKYNPHPSINKPSE